MQTNQKNKNIIILASLIFLLIAGISLFISANKNSNNNEEILEIKIVIKDHKFVPDIVEVPKSTKIRLVIHNEDDTVEEFESHDLHREKIVMPHDSIKIILAPLNPGKYDFFGDFHPDTAQGFLIVKD